MFFKKLVDKRNDKVKFEIIPKTNEENKSVTYGIFLFIESYRFLSSSLDSLVKILVVNSHKTLKDLKDEIVDNDEILNIVNEIEEEDIGIKDLKKHYPEENKKLEEPLLKYTGENYPKILKTGFTDKRKYLTEKLPFPHE